MLVAAWAQLCWWSAPASAQRSAAAETYTCAPSPPPNTHTDIPECSQCKYQSANDVKRQASYVILQLTVGVCQVLDVSEEFSLSQYSVLQNGRRRGDSNTHTSHTSHTRHTRHTHMSGVVGRRSPSNVWRGRTLYHQTTKDSKFFEFCALNTT